MQRSQRARLSEREWEEKHGFTTKVKNNVREECYSAYLQFCKSIGLEPAAEILYNLSVSRIYR